MNKDKTVELLLPAGGLDTLICAVDYGADAVYIGGQRFGLRAKADNFSIEDMKKGVEYAHAHGAKVYLTVNIFAHNNDIHEIPEYFKEIKDVGLDAVLISDPGVFMLAKKYMPEMELHISTQANNTNYETFNFWYGMGAKRVVTARELSLAEIKEIRANIPDDLEIEAFMHGAMCISYSGRCLLSNYMAGRDANRGLCTHPCRWKYAVVEESRPGEYMPIEEDERGTYIFNSKDLCMIEHIPEMIEAGIYSFKIEGRMKTKLYVAAAARTYREAIDDYLESPELYKSKIEHYKEQISACTYRQFTTGFYFGKPDSDSQIYDSNTYVRNYIYLGVIEEVNDDGSVLLYQKNKFCIGDNVEIMDFRKGDIKAEVKSIRDEYGREQESAPHPSQKLYIKFNISADCLKKGMIIRMNSN
ncbi:putative protease [Eubacterium ruminantium]|uniref:Putative protease n=1 Tax=Eubacterium ruminantium TaxID=42322 RepID=A0A1T4MJA1_9FIRM|nr:MULTISPECIES: U32 family peptidase [Eubacterium]MCR5367895.1 U32 family peptidase [Eubacterium sp.]SCW48535.1 putative protease [Eubacterium ruminantium]SDM57765.1 putative protease [Eubacterium ruminantium]SJZ67119.1 putative protease [Eubacterium ruminantium]